MLPTFPSQSASLADRLSWYIARAYARNELPRISALAHFLSLGKHTRQSHKDALEWLQKVHTDIHTALMSEYPESHPEQPVTVFYTTAPDAYDGFGTETLGMAGTVDRKPLRKVEILDQHQDWQLDRYGSGMHRAYSETEFTELQTFPWYTPEEGESHGRTVS